MFLVAQRVSNSSCNRLFSARWLWRGYDFLCNSLRLPAFAAHGWICPEGTGRHVPPPRGHSQGVCREAGATVRCNTKLSRLEHRKFLSSLRERLRSWPLVCQSITGAQLAVDITLLEVSRAPTQRTLMEQCSTVQEWRKPRSAQNCWREVVANWLLALRLVADGTAWWQTSWT